MLPALLFLILLSLAPLAPAALAQPVVEREVIRIEGAPDRARERAMAQAQRQAVERLAGRAVSQGEIDAAVVYTSIAAELIAGARYQASFDVAIDRARLKVREATAHATGSEAGSEARWVLLVPARIMPHGVEVWNLDDPWSMVWRREMMPGTIAIGAVTGDDEDLELLSQAQAQARDREALRRLARKYGAQGAALAVIDEAGVFAADPNASASNDVLIETLYVPVDGPPAHVMVGLTRLAQGGVRDIARQLAGVIRKLAADSAAGVVMGQPPQFLTPPQPGETAALWRSQAALAPPSVAVGGGVGTAGSAVWRGVDGQSAHFFRTRVRNAVEWQTLADKLASIPGAKFTPVASAQGWLQGYIGYNGSADALRRELIQRNIPTE